jgi:hypothetical protein
MIRQNMADGQTMLVGGGVYRLGSYFQKCGESSFSSNTLRDEPEKSEYTLIQNER